MPENLSNNTNNIQIEEPEISEIWFTMLRWVIVCVVLIILSIAAIGWGIYSKGWQNYFVDSVTKIIPFPAASLGYSNWISLQDYNENVRAAKKFLESKEAAESQGNFDFSTPEGLKKLAIVKKSILNQLIENKIIKEIANKNGIFISNEEVESSAKELLGQNGNEKENLTELDFLYGWDEKDFKDRVIRDTLYRKKLEEFVTKQGLLDNEAKSKISKIQEKLSQGVSFSDIANEFSDSPSSQYGGLLPEYTQDEASPVLAEAFKIKDGETSRPIESDEGWHIIQVQRKWQENGKNKAEVRQIFIKRKNFQDWFKEQKKGYKIHVLLSQYFWHDQMGKLYFKDNELNEYENQLNRNYLEEKSQEADFLLRLNNKK